MGLRKSQHELWGLSMEIRAELCASLQLQDFLDQP